MPRLTPYREHELKWADGCGSSECGGARNICFRRGPISAHMLIIGEAPGIGEDNIGKPFVGQSGHLIDYMVAKACKAAGMWSGEDPDVTEFIDLGEAAIRVCFGNVVNCIPRDPDDPHGWVKPTKPQIKSCMPRLIEFVELVNPMLIVRAGDVAKQNLTEKMMVKMNLPRRRLVVDLFHPSWILRQDVYRQSTEINRWVVSLTTAMENVFHGFQR